MTDTTLNRNSEILRGLFELLWTKPEGLPAKEIFASLPEVTRLNEYEGGHSASSPNAPRDERVIRLVSIPLFKAGWLTTNEKGRWYITEEGRQACQQYPNAQELYKASIKLLEDGKQSLSLSTMVIEEAEEKAWEQIHRFLQEANRIEFQVLTADLIRALGYHVAWVAPPEKNRGQIDIVAYVDPIGVKGPRILVQVKHTGQAVTREGLKAFLSVLGNENYGLFISSGGFTPSAMDEVKGETFKKTTILDLEGFFDLWAEYYDKLSHDARMRFPLKAIYFLNIHE